MMALRSYSKAVQQEKTLATKQRARCHTATLTGNGQKVSNFPSPLRQQGVQSFYVRIWPQSIVFFSHQPGRLPAYFAPSPASRGLAFGGLTPREPLLSPFFLLPTVYWLLTTHNLLSNCPLDRLQNS